MKNYKVGIIGATGMVGQRLITLLANVLKFFKNTSSTAKAVPLPLKGKASEVSANL